MKHVLSIVILLMFNYSFSQDVKLSDNLKVNDLKIELSVNTLKELKNFKVKDLDKVINSVEKNSELVFIINCNLKTNNLNRKISYKIEGNSNNPKIFKRAISKLKLKAKHYYKTI